jgi:tetratricopeptide (TPR) repeat protein
MYDNLFQRCYAVLMYDDLEEYEDAIRALTEHLRANPGSAAALNNRAVAFAEIGQTKRALADFRAAIRLAPADPMPARNCAELLHKLGDLPAARESFDLVLQP